MYESREKLEIDLLFEAMFRRYGYDFRNYAFDSALRRVKFHTQKNHYKNIGALQHAIIGDERKADALLIDLSINVTEMFRDPAFFSQLRKSVLPLLGTEESLKIWHAGCASGEEVYSMAILLNELDMLQQTRLYATDFNHEILARAQAGYVDLKTMRKHIQNYHKSGGEFEFSDYYHAGSSQALFNKSLRKQIMFSQHNLVGDGVFGEMHLIICRNVLIYFNKELQNRVFQLFNDSLAEGGFLCLGSHETLNLSPIRCEFEVISQGQRIYQKKTPA